MNNLKLLQSLHPADYLFYYFYLLRVTQLRRTHEVLLKVELIEIGDQVHRQLTVDAHAERNSGVFQEVRVVRCRNPPQYLNLSE